jgi:C-terminal processing protease CtpA/Prc
LPLLYTNPIRTVQLEYLSTELNLKPLLTIANDNTSDKETKEFCKKLSEKMKNNPNKFVSFSDDIVDEKKFDTIYKYPNKVAILINENCASSAEQFVYEARQSYKVKLFGRSTYGAIDISNMNSLVFSTDNRFTLWYSTSKSYRIPDLIADDIGFPPDYYYDKTIKPYEWIDKTIEILNYK